MTDSIQIGQARPVGPVGEHLAYGLSRWLVLLAALSPLTLGCTYSGGNRPGRKAQMSTADPYTYEFEKRIPPGGD